MPRGQAITLFAQNTRLSQVRDGVVLGQGSFQITKLFVRASQPPARFQNKLGLRGGVDQMLEEFRREQVTTLGVVRPGVLEECALSLDGDRGPRSDPRDWGWLRLSAAGRYQDGS